VNRPLEKGAMAALGRYGPLSIDALGAEMLASGATKSQNPSQAAAQAVAGSLRFQQLDDGRWLDKLAALRLARLPHRTTVLEHRLEALRIDPDFTVLGDLVEHGILQAWPGWGGVRVVWLRDSSLDARYRPMPERFLSLPFGALDDFAAGSSIVVSVDHEVPILELRLLKEHVDSDDSVIQLFREVVGPRLRSRNELSHDRWSTPPHGGIADVVFEALGRQPNLLARAGTPVGAMLARCGLETHREFFGRRGTLWARVDADSHVWDLIDAADAETPEWDDWDGRFPPRIDGLSPGLSL
jgi:hypothetical protein